MYIIVGLGNPGKKYEQTRHNVGFVFLDYICSLQNVKAERFRFRSLCAEGRMGTEKVLFMKPQTYMNLSGEAVAEAMEYYKVPSENVIVVYDDISMPAGALRIRGKGSAGGHNGIKNIIYMIESDVFPRIKIGVGAPKHQEHDLKDFVLGTIGKEEGQEITQRIKDAAEACKLIVAGDTTTAMNRYNTTGEKKEQ